MTGSGGRVEGKWSTKVGMLLNPKNTVVTWIFFKSDRATWALSPLHALQEL